LGKENNTPPVFILDAQDKTSGIYFQPPQTVGGTNIDSPTKVARIVPN